MYVFWFELYMRSYWCILFSYFYVCNPFMSNDVYLLYSIILLCVCVRWWTFAVLTRFLFLGPHVLHMEVPRVGVQSELQLLAYTTATATPNLSSIFDLHHSSWQCWILKLLSKARDRTLVLVDTSQVGYHWATVVTLTSFLFVLFFGGFFGLLSFSRTAPVPYGGSQARSLIRAVRAGLRHSHSNTRSKPRLDLATPDP